MKASKFSDAQKTFVLKHNKHSGEEITFRTYALSVGLVTRWAARYDWGRRCVMTEKPKSRPTGRTSKGSRIRRDAVSGGLSSASRSSPTESEHYTLPDPVPPLPRPKLQARPAEEDVDVNQFVKDLLLTDSDVMDYLAR
jgi:hypothetical protein